MLPAISVPTPNGDPHAANIAPSPPVEQYALDETLLGKLNISISGFPVTTQIALGLTLSRSLQCSCTSEVVIYVKSNM